MGRGAARGGPEPSGRGNGGRGLGITTGCSTGRAGGADTANAASAAPTDAVVVLRGQAKRRRIEGATGSATPPQKPQSVCNKCKLPGHVAKRCPTICGVCSEAGHTGENCPTKATCGHCGRYGHAASQCTFGLHPNERFIFCGARRSGASEETTNGYEEDGAGVSRCLCFPRHFVVPLVRASAAFDVERLRVGRVDVGLRCITASLFRSQSLRTNAQVTLCFGASQRSVRVAGALVRDLRPDERSLAERVRAVSACDGFELNAHPAGDPKVWSQSLTRGFYSFPGNPLEVVKGILDGQGDSPRPAAMLLTAAGKPIEKVLSKLAGTGALAGGLIVLLGDDRGLTEADEESVSAVVKAYGGKLSRVSLGGDVLFASHSIVLVNHYLDKLVHSCELRASRHYNR